MISLALYQPDIPQNTGTLLRLTACLGLECHLIGPLGFRTDDRSLRRAGLDYLDRAKIVHHSSWDDFQALRNARPCRLVLATTKAQGAYTAFKYQEGDIILVGRESAGVPTEVHQACDARVVIPMIADIRSINIAIAADMVVGEALRQTQGFPTLPTS